MAKIVLEPVALILQRIECLVLDLPAGSTTTHDVVHVLLVEPKVRHPTEVLPPTAGVNLPVFDDNRWFLRSCLFFHAGRTVYFVGGEISGAIERE
ncbi:MAG: hypothetical protein IID46_09605 [Planctomycetes bacterium]|nr:hypothetical protein [Planctomycetota bacterium]